MAIEDIVVIHDFISDEENNALLEYEKYLDANSLWDNSNSENDPGKQWDSRFLGASTLLSVDRGFGKPKDLEIFDLICKIRKKIEKQIIESYKLNFRVYADSMNLIKWPHGYIQPAHSDFENYGGEPHIYNWREIGCVLYLNDNFDGGQIHFPQHGVEVPVRPKMLAFFPGDVHHSHGVQRVLNGTRYTMSSFWTKYAQHSDHATQID